MLDVCGGVGMMVIDGQTREETSLGADVPDVWSKRTIPVADLLDVSGCNYHYDRPEKERGILWL